MGTISGLKGLQHIGIPTADLKKSVDFYEKLGFVKIFKTAEGENPEIVFMDLKGLVIELYPTDNPAQTAGPFDHVAIDVEDINKAFEEATAAGYKFISPSIRTMNNLFKNGVSFFIIEGPNKERIEFNQFL